MALCLSAQELTTTAKVNQLKPNLYLLGLPVSLPVRHPLSVCPSGAHSNFWLRMKNFSQLCFLHNRNICKSSQCHSCICKNELMKEMNKDQLTQSGRIFSFALEVWKTGNNLWFFTANALSDNYSPVDLHKFQHS